MILLIYERIIEIVYMRHIMQISPDRIHVRGVSFSCLIECNEKYVVHETRKEIHSNVNKRNQSCN